MPESPPRVGDRVLAPLVMRAHQSSKRRTTAREKISVKELDHEVKKAIAQFSANECDIMGRLNTFSSNEYFGKLPNAFFKALD